jgi:hypothetical protein
MALRELDKAIFAVLDALSAEVVTGLRVADDAVAARGAYVSQYQNAASTLRDRMRNLVDAMDAEGAPDA